MQAKLACLSPKAQNNHFAFSVFRFKEKNSFA